MSVIDKYLAWEHGYMAGMNDTRSIYEGKRGEDTENLYFKEFLEAMGVRFYGPEKEGP